MRAALSPDSPARWVTATVARVAGEVAEVTASAYGSVVRLGVAEGDLVHDRQLVIELEHRDLDQNVRLAAVELARALGASAAVAGRKDAEASAVLSRAELPAPRDLVLVQARYSLAQLRRSQADARAPVPGRVLGVHVRPREYVTPGQPLVSILDSGQSWVLAHFDPVHFGRLRIGQPASVTVAAEFVEARVTGLLRPDEPVLLELVGYLRGARPGMTASVTVAAE